MPSVPEHADGGRRRIGVQQPGALAVGENLPSIRGKRTGTRLNHNLFKYYLFMVGGRLVNRTGNIVNRPRYTGKQENVIMRSAVADNGVAWFYYRRRHLLLFLLLLSSLSRSLFLYLSTFIYQSNRPSIRPCVLRAASFVNAYRTSAVRAAASPETPLA